MGGLKQPIGQVRLTNVATVRLKKGGERFEVACYKNKILNWRSGVETDIQEVLQSPHIFTSISKGKLANNEQLKRAFNTTDTESICMLILDKGEIQVSKEEREQFLAATFKDVVTIITEISINPVTGYPLTSTLIENTLRSIGFSVSLNESAKKQALKALTNLQRHYPNEIARSQMRLRITCQPDQVNEVLEFLKINEAYIESDTTNVATTTSKACDDGRGGGFTGIQFLCCPKLYRSIDAFVTTKMNPPGALQVVALNVKDAGNKGLNVDKMLLEEHENLVHELEKKMSIDTPSSKTDAINPITSKASKFKCTQCNIELGSPAEYRTHCKSEFHVVNSKRRLKEEPPLTWEEFTAMEIYVDLTR
ncbi:bifunctional Ribosome maturation protein Sdo1-SBDS [Babesia duncani]|uniref:Bifunctional Ribosome maturation protein Sdo1-SBDS n=1 Tax=Babesia duncani TaxID=323732 RepID=A0AAD9UPY2_9APIC|nr:bifunctional Ribosome maturation protein Sdo1-SBDS [Babesia duncani]